MKQVFICSSLYRKSIRHERAGSRLWLVLLSVHLETPLNAGAVNWPTSSVVAFFTEVWPEQYKCFAVVTVQCFLFYRCWSSLTVDLRWGRRLWIRLPAGIGPLCRSRTSIFQCLWTRGSRWWRSSISFQPGAPGRSRYQSPSGRSWYRFRGPAPVRPVPRGEIQWGLCANWAKCMCRCRGACWAPVSHTLSSNWGHAKPASPQRITLTLTMTLACVEPSARWGLTHISTSIEQTGTQFGAVIQKKSELARFLS